MPIDIKYNPFDHMNAVSDPTLFIGREQELKDIRYYFEQSRLAPRPFHLAIIGERGSGKTSVLNMAERTGRECGFCVARINLNESNVSSTLQFLFKIFSAIIEAVIRLDCTEGGACLGGPNGPIYTTYIDTITTYTVPPPDQRTFTFPVQYAMAMSAGRNDAPIIEDAFESDLKKLHAAVQRPIALLFDECNLLADKRADLQMLRNIFMNTPGYMLVLSGTPEMFPIMSDVFSPIARQFTRIEIKPFADIMETKRAISVPFKQIGLEPGLSRLPWINTRDLQEIHELSGGKPHEIQLICHCLTRQIQEGKKRTVEIDMDLLDQVLLELRKGVDLSQHPVISAIREMNEKQIDELAIFMQAEGATFTQYEFVETAFKLPKRPKINRKIFEWAIDAGVFRLDDDKIVFCGDSFDKVYCRYYASRRGATIYFNFLPVDLYLATRMARYAHDEMGLDLLGWHDPEQSILVARSARPVDNDEGRPVVTISPIALRRLFFAEFEAVHCGVAGFPNYSAIVKYGGVSAAAIFLPSEIRKFDPALADVKFRNLRQRLEILGAEFTYTSGEVDSTTVEQIYETTKAFLSGSPTTEWEAETEREFFSFFIGVYTERHDIILARAYADALSIAFDRTSAEMANNIGYFHMAVNNLPSAALYLERAESQLEDEDNDSRRLVSYNLAILRLLQGKFSESRKQYEIAREVKNTPVDSAQCLLVPEIESKAVRLRERWNPKYKFAFEALDRALQKIADETVHIDVPAPIVLESDSPNVSFHK